MENALGLHLDDNIKSRKADIKISRATKEKAESAKSFIERFVFDTEKYFRKKDEDALIKEKWNELESEMENMNLNHTEKELIKSEVFHIEAERLRVKRQKLTANRFEPLVIIGRGAFGEVRLCRDKTNDEVLAVKKMKKKEMIFKNQISHVRAERDALANSNLEWIVQLKFSFQDHKHLYLVMEYLPGGDLMTQLMKKDIFTEEEARFYTAEIVLAIESVHKMNYIHRDLKPDNILIGEDGHIKLSDFGLCKYMETHNQMNLLEKISETNPGSNSSIVSNSKPFQRSRKLAFSTVGTPDYIAPEIFIQKGYSHTVDWWSVGVILFEMLIGYPPFFSDDPSTTCQKIINWKRHFKIPDEPKISISAKDLILKLMRDKSDRLGVNGVEEIKSHPFFYGVDWKNMKRKTPPYIPKLSSKIDVSNFDKFEEEEPWYIEEPKVRKSKIDDLAFAGYTFKREAGDQRDSIKKALENLETTKYSQFRKSEVKQIKSITPQLKSEANASPREIKGKELFKSETPGAYRLLRNLDANKRKTSRSPQEKSVSPIMKTEISCDNETQNRFENSNFEKFFANSQNQTKFNQFEFSNFFKNKVSTSRGILKAFKKENVKASASPLSKDQNPEKSLKTGFTASSPKNFNFKFKDFLNAKRDKKIF